MVLGACHQSLNTNHPAQGPRGCAYSLPLAYPIYSGASGKQKRPRRAVFIALIFLRKLGAGEGIRTLDPNLGKVPWADSLASKSVVVLLRLFRQPKGAIEIILPLPCLQPAFGFKPFEVGQVSQ